MSEQVETLANNQNIQELIDDIRKEGEGIVETFREYRKSIFRWMLFFAILQTATSCAFLVYIAKQ